VTDGRTDGQTNIFPRHNPRYAYASRGENHANNVAFLPRHASIKRGLNSHGHVVSVCMSVRPSVTFVDCVKANKGIFSIF